MDTKHERRAVAGGSALAPTFGGRFAAARQRLVAVQKSTAAVPAYTRYINRRAGGYLACIAFALKVVTPAQVSALSMLCSSAGLITLAATPSTVTIGVVVTLATALGYALDSADGQLARLSGSGTLAGEWLDHALDMAKTVLLHSCVLIALYRYFDLRAYLLLVPLVFLLAQVTNFFGNMLRDALRIQAGSSRQPPSKHSSLRSSLLLLPTDHGTLCWTFVLLGWHPIFMSCYTLLAVIAAGFSCRAQVRSYRNLATLGATSHL